ncbi:HAD family hydrolase [Burkholderia diffusa]|uniref:HAD superfamily hydrolase n=1 Tax=Burkholderia diffusa TaxID=488732 RepID=A0A6P2GRN2_9BURK|nr:HAD family hydrolase [Burkholderia diffusa]KAB0654854.1 HAD family hydrolase [Burkholderia diffusa]MBM2650937.1 HAD family hydrolase [Burkholderia diffusa]VWB06349.1 HAD superfamily hydrolase [Burkholderia diffusa]
MTIRALVFDAFGTLAEIQDQRRPFARLARVSRDRRQRELLMTRAISLKEAGRALGGDRIDMAALDADLTAELASIRLFPDVVGTLEEARARGLKVGIASNLAAPYAEPLLRLLPFKPDVCAWSFEVGYLKPDPRIFAWLCERLDVAACEALMVGDTFRDDYAGALASGLHALQLDRRGHVGCQKPAVTIRTLHDVLPALRHLSESVSGGQTGSVGLS